VVEEIALECQINHHKKSENSTVASRTHKARAFFSGNPVFTRDEFASALGHVPSAATVASLLGYHLRAGNIKRVSRQVFASVPPHLNADRFMVDQFAAAAKLRPDGVLGYHSALELHGIAYSVFSEVQIISTGRAERDAAPLDGCRFINHPRALIDAGKVDILTTTMDRRGQMIRVTDVERTVADVLHRSDIAGGTDEVLPSLDQLHYLRPAKVIDYVSVLRNRTLASVVGWWLERNRSRLGVADNELAELRTMRPRSKHYALGARPGNAILIEPWGVLLPSRAVDDSFEGL
jgi:predicted transcriptional regulator of viral defense system